MTSREWVALALCVLAGADVVAAERMPLCRKGMNDSYIWHLGSSQHREEGKCVSHVTAAATAWARRNGYLPTAERCCVALVEGEISPGILYAQLMCDVQAPPAREMPAMPIAFEEGPFFEFDAGTCQMRVAGEAEPRNGKNCPSILSIEELHSALQLPFDRILADVHYGPDGRAYQVRLFRLNDERIERALKGIHMSPVPPGEKLLDSLLVRLALTRSGTSVALIEQCGKRYRQWNVVGVKWIPSRWNARDVAIDRAFVEE